MHQYYDLPFCRPDGKVEKTEALGEVLEGDRMVSTPYDLSFLQDYKNEVICKKDLTEKDLELLRKAVKEDYYFQMYYDDLPIWGFIGKVKIALVLKRTQV